MISRRESEGEVVYKAYTRELNPLEFYGVGDTKLEALQCFEDTKNELIELHLEEGSEIPEPTREDEGLPSGKFLLRTTPRLHFKVIQSAKSQGKSLNSYVCEVLIEHEAGRGIMETFHQLMHVSINKQRNIYTIASSQSEAQSQMIAYNPNYSTEDPIPEKSAA